MTTWTMRRLARAGIGVAAVVLLGSMMLIGVASALPDQRLAWGFGEGSGTTVTDTSSNGRDAVATTPVWNPNGRYGGAMSFNGASSRVTSAAELTLGAAFTVEAWVRNPTASGAETIWTVGADRDLYLIDGVPNFWAGNANLQFGPALAVDTWQHLALVSTGTTVSLYVDGTPRGTPQNLALTPLTGRLQLGAWPFYGDNVDYFSGSIDEVRLYDRALSPTEIATDRDEPIGASGGPTATTTPTTTPPTSTMPTTTTSTMPTTTTTTPPPPGGTWAATTALPTPRSANGAVAANGFLYLAGGIGDSGAAVPTVSFAPLLPDGSVGAWATTTPLPVPTRSTTVAHADGYLYVAGGSDGNSLTAAVYVAPVNGDGTVGAWSATTPLPRPVFSHATVAAGDYLYVIGGNPDGCVPTVLVAPLAPNGAAGPWTATTPLPAARCGVVEAAAVSDGFVYLVGGFDNGAITNRVLYAPIGTGGAIGAWQTNAGSLVVPRQYTAVEAVGGTLYVIAGQGAGGVITEVEQATINPDGSLGPFSVTSNLPAPRNYQGGASAGGRLYAVGGGAAITGGWAQSGVFTTPATAGGAPPTTTTTPATTTTTATTTTPPPTTTTTTPPMTTPPPTTTTTTPPMTTPPPTTTTTTPPMTTTPPPTTTTTTPPTTTPPTGQQQAALEWGFGEGSGTTVTDSSSNGRDAVATAPVWNPTGRYGGAMTFNGTTTRVTSTTDLTLVAAFTVEAWVRNPVASGAETIWTIGADRDLYLIDGVPNFWAGNANLQFGPALAPDTWQHLALVSTGTTLTLYVDGTPWGQPRNLTLTPYTGPLQLGAWPFYGDNVDQFSGTIDDVRLYDRALTPTEITTDRDSPIG